MNWRRFVSGLNCDEIAELTHALNERRERDEIAKVVQLTAEETHLLKSGKRVNTIIAVRERTGLGLAVAISAVDSAQFELAAQLLG